MNLLLRLLLLLGLIAAPACHLSFGGVSLDHSEERTQDWALDGLTTVHVVSRAGSLEISGGSRADVHMEGIARASTLDALEAYRVVTTRVGDTLRIEPQLEHDVGHENVAFDMRLELPSGVALRLTDGSGSIVVRDVASLAVEDSSGSILVERIAGDVSIDDGSGSITARGIDGALTIADGSGSIEIHDIGGAVTLRDGSGGVSIDDVRGGVHVLVDGSGSLEIRNVTGDVRIDSDGSGSVSVHDVRGDVHLGPLGSGSLNHENVSGSVFLVN